MKVIILGGFLGTGKTSVLLQLAPYIRKISNKKTALAIIENEIGEISVDSKLLNGYEVRELFAGCICCTLTAGLGTALREINREYDPEYVVVEATGLAIVNKIAEVIRQYLPEVTSLTTVTLADAQRWDDLIEGMDVFLENQLRGSDYILLNKCDLVPKEDMERIEQVLRKLEPNAKVLATSASKDMKETIKIIIGGET